MGRVSRPVEVSVVEVSSEPDPHVLGPGQAPTPFTADEIRTGCPVGRTSRLRVDQPGLPSTYRIHRFVRCDADGADIARGDIAEDGTLIGDEDVAWSTWRELQGHASFPAERTEIAVDDLDSPMGVLRCRVYTVVDDSRHAIFWFAESIAGMPVKVETRTTSGELTSTVTMVANDLP